jgi:hypothetical protein
MRRARNRLTLAASALLLLAALIAALVQIMAARVA